MISSAPELTPSRWREFKFVLNQVQRTIEPDMSLHDVLTEWPDISRGLSEPMRKRRPQMERYFPKRYPCDEIITRLMVSHSTIFVTGSRSGLLNRPSRPIVMISVGISLPSRPTWAMLVSPRRCTTSMQPRSCCGRSPRMPRHTTWGGSRHD